MCMYSVHEHEQPVLGTSNRIENSMVKPIVCCNGMVQESVVGQAHTPVATRPSPPTPGHLVVNHFPTAA